jgi:hypothetical protein
MLNWTELIARNSVTTYIWITMTGPYFDNILFAVVKGGFCILQHFSKLVVDQYIDHWVTWREQFVLETDSYKPSWETPFPQVTRVS